MTPPTQGRRLDRYEARTDRPLLVLAVGFVAVYAVQVTAPDRPAGVHRALEAVTWLVWLAFAAGPRSADHVGGTGQAVGTGASDG